VSVEAILNSPFVSVALPIVSTIWAGIWIQNKRFDDVNKRFDDVNRRLDKIEVRLDRIEDMLQAHDQRLTRLEERTSLVRN
jgi:archaellum component FlaC